MYTFLFITILILPIFNTEPIQAGFDSNDIDDDDLLMQRAVAASYLFNLPISRYHQLLKNDDQSERQRAKRIYWENLAFHAADYSQKPKKV